MSALVEVAVAMTLAVMGTAQAQPPLPSHFSWDGKAGHMDLYLHKHGHSVVEVSTGTCLGNVGGPVKVVGRTVVLKAKNEPGGEGTCVLRVTFNGNYTRASITEKNCTHWHGVSCQFEGPVLRRRK